MPAFNGLSDCEARSADGRQIKVKYSAGTRISTKSRVVEEEEEEEGARGREGCQIKSDRRRRGDRKTRPTAVHHEPNIS